MTDEQINKAIAEVCGWIWVHKEQWESPSGDLMNKFSIPNYCNDLNAIHEAEKILGDKLSQYGNQLCDSTLANEGDKPECYIWHATARQRAKAFLRTLGKWEEVQM